MNGAERASGIAPVGEVIRTNDRFHGGMEPPGNWRDACRRGSVWQKDNEL
jgi:hypothetical protein